MDDERTHEASRVRAAYVRDAVAFRYGALAAVVTATALWGLGGTVAGRLFAQGASPLEVVALRTWISLAGLAALLAWRRPKRPAGPIPWRAVIGFGLSVAVANAALFLAIDRLPVAIALVLQNLAPAFVMGWTLAFARRPPSRRIVIGMAVALAGVAVVVELPTAPLAGIDVLGVAFGLLTAMGVAAFSAFGGQAARVCGALTASTLAFAVSSVLWLFYQLPRGVPELFDRPELLGGTVAVGLFGTLVPFLLYSWGTARLGPQIGAVSISLEPLFGAVLAWTWLGQTLNAVQLVGSAALLIAVIDLQRTHVPAASAAPTRASEGRSLGSPPRTHGGGRPAIAIATPAPAHSTDSA